MKITISTMLGMIATFIVGLAGGLAGGVLVSQDKKDSQPKIDLPEELMCVVSDIENKPDTVLAFQSKNNDSLYIRFK